LVLSGRSKLNGFASRDGELFWSIGVLECWKKLEPEFQLEKVFIITPLLHHSSDPALRKDRFWEQLRAWIPYVEW
jgi:hypothetical protein